MNMKRKLMRTVRRGTQQRSQQHSTGFIRAGMHQQAEMAFRRTRMEQSGSELPDALELLKPPSLRELESEMPPEDLNEETAEDVAEGEAVIAADPAVTNTVDVDEPSEVADKPEVEVTADDGTLFAEPLDK